VKTIAREPSIDSVVFLQVSEDLLYISSCPRLGDDRAELREILD